MDKLNKLYQIESALTTCSLSIPMGLRKESQLGIALSNVEELIELEIQDHVERGNAAGIALSYTEEYQQMNNDIKLKGKEKWKELELKDM